MSYNGKASKNGWTLLLLLLAGIVIGGLIGELATNLSFLKWLNYGYSFGFSNPISLDLKIISILFQMRFDITIASIIGIAVAVIAYKKI